MRISVIIPCHNAGPWVRGTLESVARQTRPADEIIVINDRSTDDSAAQIKASGVPVTLLETELGNAAAARNHGIAQASGDWIAFLDADDQWYPEHLKRAAQLLDRSQDVAFLSMMDDGYDDGTVVKAVNQWPVSGPTSGLTPDQCIRFWNKHRAWPLINMVVRRDRFNDVGGFDPTQRAGHDFEMWLRVIYGRTWAYDPVTTSRRLITAGSVSRGNRIQVGYFVVRGLLKNRPQYALPEYDSLIGRFARFTASLIVFAGEMEEHREELAFVWPHLEPRDRLFLALGRRCPPLYRWAHRARQRLLGNRKPRRETELSGLLSKD